MNAHLRTLRRPRTLATLATVVAGSVVLSLVVATAAQAATLLSADFEDGSTAAWQKLTSADPRLGFFAAANDLAAKLSSGVLPPDKAAVAPQLIFNQRLDAWLTLFFLAVVWFVILDMARVSIRYLRGLPVSGSSEAPYQVSRSTSP